MHLHMENRDHGFVWCSSVVGTRRLLGCGTWRGERAIWLGSLLSSVDFSWRNIDSTWEAAGGACL